MISDGRKFGRLVKVFPHEALNSKYTYQKIIQEKLLYLLGQNMHLSPILD
jgi:hypothetical protein